MAVAIIIIGTLSIIATVMATLALAPVIQEMGTDTAGNWDKQLENQAATCDVGDTTCEELKLNAQRALLSRDRAFDAILVLPIFLIGAIACWAFLAVTRRDFGEI